MAGNGFRDRVGNGFLRDVGDKNSLSTEFSGCIQLSVLPILNATNKYFKADAQKAARPLN
ncbi:MAG: hypothetical protein KUG83_04095 [Gammaproteobacteria bacterium]|nr:hypothetical protein [Gammaproteobacteria bacterium]